MSLDGVRIDPAPASIDPVVILKNAEGFTLSHSQAATLRISGNKTRSVRLIQTDSKVTRDADVPTTAVTRSVN